MSVDTTPVPNRQQDLYWRELVQLKVACEYIRRWRNLTSAWVTRFAIVRAFASSSAIGAWAVFREWPLLWAGIIATAQVADALQGAIPFRRRQTSSSALLTTLDALFIDAQMEWEDVFAGRLDEVAINKRRGRLMKLRLEAEAKQFPSGLPVRRDLFRLAEQDANAYFDNEARSDRPQ